MGQFGKLGSVVDGTATTPEDIQQILAARYVNSSVGPIIKGGVISGRGDRAYAYTAGVGQVPTPAGAVDVAWPAGVTALVPTPATTRVDVIYADDNGDIFVAPEGSVPAQACILGKRSLPAGATSTATATDVWNRRWALPYGAQLGWIGGPWVETYNHGLETNQARITWRSVNFWVPTDRHCQLRMHQAIYGQHDAGAPYTDPAQSGIGAMKYWVYLDNVLKREFELSYSRVFEPKLYFVDLEANMGEHTVRVEREHVWGAKPYHFGSATNQPGSVGVFDQGVKE